MYVWWDIQIQQYFPNKNKRQKSLFMTWLQAMKVIQMEHLKHYWIWIPMSWKPKRKQAIDKFFPQKKQ